ncbi:MAG: SPOR domain-containing protein [Burkholderiaceae bacterium]|nr:SPOR domain-containing protein [Burkholderiaceae bacterium]
MRFIFIVLILLNLLLWGAGSGWFGPVLPFFTRLEAPMSSLEANSVQVVPPSNKNLESNHKPAPPAVEHSTQAIAPAIVANTVNTPPLIRCLQWSSSNADEIKATQALLAEFNLGRKLVELVEADVTQWTVVLGPFIDRPTAERKREEVKRRGITDLAVIENVRGRYVSLGIFSTRENAQARLSEVTEKGIDSARIDSRVVGATKPVTFQIRDIDAQLQAQLSARGLLQNASGWTECKT